MNKPLSIKHEYFDGNCHVVKLSDGQEACGRSPSHARTTAQRIIDGSFKPVRSDYVDHRE